MVSTINMRPSLFLQDSSVLTRDIFNFNCHLVNYFLLTAQPIGCYQAKNKMRKRDAK